jgi:hypothetical protein
LTAGESLMFETKDLSSRQKGVLVLVGAIILIIWVANRDSDKKNSIGASTTAPTEVLRFTAQEMFNAYEANEIATDERLKGRIIEISGVVQSIDKSVWDTNLCQARDE